MRRCVVAATAVAAVLLGASAVPAHADAAIERLVVTFDQATYTTSYHLELADPAGVEVTWRLEPSEDCGVFTASDTDAAWTHPHESQRDDPALSDFPDDRFCADTAQQSGGHPGAVRVSTFDGETTCTLVYTRGSQEGELDGGVAECALVGDSTTSQVDEVEDEDADGGGGGSASVLVIGIGLVVLVAALVAVFVRRERRDVVTIAEEIVEADVVSTTHIERIGKEGA